MDTSTRVDPNLKIPAAVLAAGAKADAYYQQPDAGTDTENGNKETQPEETAAEATATEAAEGTQATAQETVTTGSNEQPKGEDDQSWEHRYKSMKGRYDRANDQLRTLSEQVSSLQNVIATMQASAPVNPQITDAVTQVERLITPEEENDYGQEFLKVVGKKAKEELLPVINKYEAKIAELEARLQGVNGYVAQDARTRMLDALDEKIPNWREINKDENFLNWLQLPDLYSGAIRHELLKGAFERNDTPRVQAFFTGFLAEEAALDPAAGETGRSEAPAKVSLEKLAAPGRAKSAAATSAPTEKPIFTRAQIAKFYADATAGKYRGREAERDRLEAQIFSAEREGRIR